MVSRFACILCLPLVLLLLARDANGVISGPKFPREKGLLEPQVMEIPEAEEEVVAREGPQLATARLQKRQSHGIGTTTPLSGDAHTQAVVHWTGYPSEAIFVLTRRRNFQDPARHSTESWLWRSTDYGVTFHNETDKFGDPDDVVIEWYYISPVENQLIFSDRIHKMIYVTRDEGESYTSYPVPFTPDRFLFQSQRAPGSIDVSGTLHQHVLGYDSGNQTLWVSRDLGVNWIHLASNVTRYYWRVLGNDTEPSTRVYIEQAVNATHAMLLYSEDQYSSVPEFDPNLGTFLVNTFVLTHEYMFVQKNSSGNGGQYSSPLWVSRNRQPFQQARFPLLKEEKHYSVVDASENQVFIAVYHDFNNTNLYLSEEQGLNFSLSLEYIVSPPESDWVDGNPTFDVHVVEGIVGTYVANRKAPGSSYGATVISYDKGGEWTLVSPPAEDHQNNPILCVPPECSLHLHMDSDALAGYQSILSQDSAIGLIMALGNLGSTLSRSTSSLRLYFSNNGGFSWREVQERYWEFQFTAVGSIVVAVPKWLNTDYILWTCDEGASWNETEFTDTRIRVVGMRTERGERARHVTIFGYHGPGFTEWLVIDLNFVSVVPHECVPEEDYYPWVPTDERPGGRCLLGEVIQYERRNASYCCLINPAYERPVSRESCTCAIEDFECDFGFERVNLDSPCLPMPGFSWPPPPPNPCPEDSTYSYTSGYRLVAGDKCVPGNETYFFHRVVPCPVQAPLGVFLSFQPNIITPGDNVSFTFTQLLGSMIVTQYSWNFSDGSPLVVGTGYEHSRIQVHSYARPGIYSVSVRASNAAGESTARTDVLVRDLISGVTLIPPAQYTPHNQQGGYVPTDTDLLFQVNLTATYDTSYYGDLRYAWTFGEGAVIDTPTATHTYMQPGDFSFSVSISNSVSSIESHRTITAVAPPGILTLAVLRVDQLEVTFSLVDSHTINANVTTYTIEYGDDLFVEFVRVGQFSHTYQHPGVFTATVRASNIAGSGTQLTSVTILDLITSVSIVAPDHVVEGSVFTLSADITARYSTSYFTPVSYNWTFDDGSNSTMATPSHTFVAIGNHTVTLQVSNAVSQAQTSLTIDVERAPARLRVEVEDKERLQPGHPVNFRLIQTQGSTLETVYTYHFGDNRTSDSLQGFQQAEHISHVYDVPGQYMVTIVASNLAGSGSNSTQFTVLDRLANVAVYCPTLFADCHMPAGIRLQFDSSFTTEFSTSYSGDLQYKWFFGDSVNPVLTDRHAVHSYFHPGHYDVTLTLSNAVSSSSFTVKVDIFTAATEGEIINTTSGVEREQFVHVGRNVTFTVIPANTGEEILSNSSYNWTVGGIPISNTSSFSYNFPAPGPYDIRVFVNNSAHLTFPATRHLTAEYDIDEVQVALSPTVRSDITFIAVVTVFQSGHLYSGPLNLTVEDHIVIEPSVSGGMVQAHLQLSGPNTVVTLTFLLTNDVSQQTKHFTINVVGPLQYGSILLLFEPSHLPQAYRTRQWQEQLKEGIISFVTMMYSNIIQWQVEVEVRLEVAENNSTGDVTGPSGQPRSNNILKRSTEMLLAADIYILPTGLSEEETNNVKQVAEGVVAGLTTGGMNLTVGGSSIAVDDAILDPGTIQIVTRPGAEQEQKENKKLYLGLGVGLGMGLLLVIMISIALIYGTYHYHKKYSRLRVRYSRLQQSPVRFTFTQRGEMMEEDDEGDADSVDSPSYDTKMETISVPKVQETPAT